MDEATLTVVGRIGQPPILRTGAKGDWTSFTVATNARYKQGDTWVDGATSWFGVNANGQLARNAVACLAKGQPVIVHGTVSISESSQDGGARRTFVNVRATAIGVDLQFGTAEYTKAERPGGTTVPRQPAAPAQDEPPRGGDWGAQAPEQQTAAPAPAWPSVTATLTAGDDVPF